MLPPRTGHLGRGMERRPGLLERLHQMLVGRCQCFRSGGGVREAEEQIDNKVAAINREIREAVERSEPLTSRTLLARDVTGRHRQRIPCMCHTEHW